MVYGAIGAIAKRIYEVYGVYLLAVYSCIYDMRSVCIFIAIGRDVDRLQRN